MRTIGLYYRHYAKYFAVNELFNSGTGYCTINQVLACDPKSKSKDMLMPKKRSFFLILSCEFLFCFTPTLDAQLLNGPYLMYFGPNTEMNVLWQTNDKTNCEIRWGLNESCSTGKAQSFEYVSDHRHKFKIAGLTAGNKYYYRVVDGPNSYSGSFRAAPDSNAGSVQFLAYGDTRTNPDRQNQVCGNILATLTENPNYQTFILHIGDWAREIRIRTGLRSFSPELTGII